MKQVYVSKLTGKEVTIERRESVKNFPNDITVFVLSNGTSWSKRCFNLNHEPKNTNVLLTLTTEEQSEWLQVDRILKRMTKACLFPVIEYDSGGCEVRAYEGNIVHKYYKETPLQAAEALQEKLIEIGLLKEIA